MTHPEIARDLGRRFAERLTFPEEPGTVKVSGEVSIAEIEPGRLPEADHLPESAKGLVAEAPASAFVDQAAQGIADSIEIGRDVEPPDQRIVARVADDAEGFRLHERIQASQQLGGAGSTGEGDEAHDRG